MAELSVEEAQSLARQFLTGKAGDAEIVQLRAALESDQTAALELLAQMQTALEDVAPAGLSVEQSAQVLAQVESLIVPRIQHRGLVGLFKKVFGSKSKPLLAPPAAPASPAPSPSPAPVPVQEKAAALPAEKATKPVSAAPAAPRAAESDLEEMVPVGVAPVPAGEEGPGEDDILPGPPPLRILPQAGAGPGAATLPPLKGLPSLAGSAPTAQPAPAAPAPAEVPSAAAPALAVQAKPKAEAAASAQTKPLPALPSPQLVRSAPAPAQAQAATGRTRSLLAGLVLVLLLAGLYWAVQARLLTLPDLSMFSQWWKPKPAPAAPPAPLPTPAAAPPVQILAQRAPAAVPPRSEPLPAELSRNP